MTRQSAIDRCHIAAASEPTIDGAGRTRARFCEHRGFSDNILIVPAYMRLGQWIEKNTNRRNLPGDRHANPNRT
jgi:hypothetical protein